MAKAQKSSSVWGEIGAASIGMALGGVLGMLFAPQSGKKTRKTVAAKSKKSVTAAAKIVKKVAATQLATAKK